MKKLFFILLIVGCICVFVYMSRQNEDYVIDFEQMDDDTFIKNVLSDYSDFRSVWISIDVESPEYSGKIVAENWDLRRYFGIEFEHYKDTMFTILKEKSTLKIESEGVLDKYHFKIVPNDADVIANAKKGINHFLKTYTTPSGTAINHRSVSEIGIYAVISQLFDFNIAVKRDCESGFLKVYKSFTEAELF